jgi:beta-lactamase class A
MRPWGYAAAALSGLALAGVLVLNKTAAPTAQVGSASLAPQLLLPQALEPDPQDAPCLSPDQLKAQQIAPPKMPPYLQGRIGLWVARFEPGQTEFKPSKVTGHNPQAVFALASNYKTAVLLEVLRQADGGQLDLAERFVITNANQSLGAYPFDNTPIPDLALRMIQWSDNTATDILHRRVGLGSLQTLADELKLCQTRLLLPTKAWWTAQAGLGGPDFPKDALLNAARRFATAAASERLQIATRLDQRAQSYRPDQISRNLDRYFEQTTDWARSAQIDRYLQNASSPLEWARYLWFAFGENGLSEAANAEFRRIMSKGFGPRLLRVKHAYAAGKSGNTAGVLGFSGFLEAEDGSRYIYVFLSDEISAIFTLDRYRRAFGLINEALLKLGAVGLEAGKK